MLRGLHYGTTAKVLHWLVAGLVIIQYSIGWLMPNIREHVASALLHVLYYRDGVMRRMLPQASAT